MMPSPNEFAYISRARRHLFKLGLTELEQDAASRLVEGDLLLLQIIDSKGAYESALDNTAIWRLEDAGLVLVSSPLARFRVRVSITPTGRELLEAVEARQNPTRSRLRNWNPGRTAPVTPPGVGRGRRLSPARSTP